MVDESRSATRSRLGSKGAAKRWGNAEQTGPATSQDANHSVDVDVLTSGLDPRVAGKLRHYLDIVGTPSDWSAVKIMEQVIAEAIKTEGNMLSLEESRGKVVPRAEMDRAVAMVRDAWWKSAQQITSDVLASLPGLPLEARELINRACGEAVARAALRVKSDLAK